MTACNSLRRWLPDQDLRVVACDVVGDPVDGMEPLPEVGPDGLRTVDLVMALGATDAGWAVLAEILDASGLAGEPVTVLSDAMRVLGPVPELTDPADGAVARVARVDDASGLGFGGALPGLLTLAGDVGPILEWWRSRAAEVARSTSDDGIAALWADLPATAVTLLSDPSLRLSMSTAGDIELRSDDHGRFLSGGAPLRLVDLDGLDPSRPWWWSPSASVPRRRNSTSPVLRRLLHDVAGDLVAAGADVELDPGPEHVAGVPVTPALRRWYRSCLRSGSVPPNPMLPDELAAFFDTLAGPGVGDGSGISVAADLVLEDRPDVAAAFPSARWSDRDGLVRWLWTHGVREQAISPAVLPDRPTRRVPISARPTGRGVNLVGYLDRDLGLGVAARSLRAALRSAGVEVTDIAYDRTSSRRSGGARSQVLEAPHAVNLLMVTPDQLPYLVADIGSELFAGRHSIGLWYWETDVLTDRQMSAFAHVDEVWGATRYLVDVFAACDRVPVSLVPVPLEFDDVVVGPGERARLGLDDRFTVLFSFDFLSVMDRKNPIGLVEAFTSAFAPADGARLILKAINGEVFPEQKEHLLDVIADRPDIELWDRYLEGGDRLALVAASDCYASLHRSEGLGLTMAEAMAVGTPVVATAYSGNLDFMDDDSAMLVPARVVEIGPGHFYPASGHWAEPDLDDAAAALRRLASDPALRQRLGRRGREALTPFSTRRVGMIAAQRLRELGLVG